MPHSLRSPNRFAIEKIRLEAAFQDVAERLRRRELETEDALLQAVMAAWREALGAIASPIFAGGAIDPEDPRRPEVLNRFFREIEHDLQLVLKAAPILTRAIEEGFNYTSALAEMVRGRVRLGETRSLDLGIVTGSLRHDLVVAGDDFQDLGRVDRARTPRDQQAELAGQGGALTLRRTASKNLAEEGAIAVRVEGPEGLYEGRLYAPAGEAEPEGGKLAFVEAEGAWAEAKRDGVSPELRSRYETLGAWLQQNPVEQRKLGIDGSLTPDAGRARAAGAPTRTFGGLTTDEWEQLAGNFHYERTFAARTAATPFDSAQEGAGPGVRIALAAAKETDKAAARQRLLDRDAATYWQAELVYDTTPEFNKVALFADEKTVEAIPAVSLDELRREVAERFDPRDLEVTLTLDLKEPRPLNFLTLHPYLADAASALEVLAISVSRDGSVFEEIAELGSGRFETRLGADVNRELTEEEIVQSLAQSRGALHGQGLFSFAPREARFVRVRLREQRPIPAPYTVLRFRLDRTVHVETSTKDFWGHVSRDHNWEVYSKHVELDYLPSLYLAQGEQEAGRLAGESASGSDSTSSRGSHLFEDFAAGAGTALAASGIGATVAVIGGIGAAIVDFVGGLLGGSKTWVDDSGWQIAEMDTVTRYDKARYVIGLRELGLFRYEYAERSEIVSVAYRTPKPISTVALEVSAAAGDGAALRYFFSLDDGKTWNRIAPLLAAPLLDGAAFVPQIFHVNSNLAAATRDRNVGYVDLGGEPAHSVRFRAMLLGSEEAPGTTPVLKGYRLLLGQDGGLR